jgi:hypothetical protein
MTRSMRLLVWVLAGALTAPAIVRADDRPVIKVEFVIVDANYKLKFTDADRPGVQAAAAARIVERIGARIGFVRFTTADGPDTVLKFELNRQDPKSTGDIREVGFHVTLSQRGQPLGEGAYVPFRPQTESLSTIPGREALIEAIGPKVADASAPRGPITALLSVVPIARQAVLVQNPLGWVIPYKHDDLCMDEASVVRLSNTVDSPVTTVVRHFTAKTSGRAKQEDMRGRIFGEPHPLAQDHLDEMKNTPVGQIKVDGVYVVQYSPRTPCDTVVPPAPRPGSQP